MLLNVVDTFLSDMLQFSLEGLLAPVPSFELFLLQWRETVQELGALAGRPTKTLVGSPCTSRRAVSLQKGVRTMDIITCPKCGTENPANAMNCQACRINLQFALGHPEEIEHLKQDSGSSALPPAPPTLSPQETLPPSTPRARRARWIVTIAVVLAILAAMGGMFWYDTLPRRIDNQHTLVLGQTQFAPDSQSAVRVIVRNTKDAQPIANANVQVSLAPQSGGQAVTLFTGKSDQNGAVAASFKIPENVQVTQTLVVETRSGIGSDKVQQPVSVKRSYKLLLTTDKPVYQPAQTIHVRALALSTLDMKAVKDADIGFLVEDPKGNKVFRKTIRSSAFGVAAADFVLADQVIFGDYKITVNLSDTSSEKTVNVKRYVLPKFAVKISTDKSYYLPGQHIAGTVQCDYFFGKPVAEGQVEIVGSVFDVQKTQIVQLQGKTDERGTYRFEFDLPKYFAGRGLEKDQAEFSLQVSVIDQAEHTEQASQVLPIAQNPIVIEIVPEAGVLKPGVENKLYLLTSYPDGTPARAKLSLTVNNGSPSQLSAGSYGLAEYTFNPSSGVAKLAVMATDEKGQSASKTVDLKADIGAGVVLLRPDRATYRVGDTMRLVALTSQNFGSLFLDIVKDGQTLSTRSEAVKDGRVEFAVDLSGDLFGALTLHGYKVLDNGSIIRDTRVVVVDAPRDVTTDIKADHEVYRPGDTARLSLHTRTASGPAQSALGVAIVDESVFAVMEQDPGFAKLYFLLQKELLEPKYQIKGWTIPEVLTPTQDAQLRATQDSAARAAWAALPPSAMAMNVNSRPIKVEAAQRDRQSGLNRVSNWILVALMLVPVGLWITVIAGLHATHVLGKSLGWTFVVALFGAPVVCGAFYGVMSALFSLSYRSTSYRQAEQIGLIILAWFVLAWLVSLIAFVVYAWLRRDERARTITLLIAAWIGLGILLGMTLALNVIPNEALAILAVLAYLLGLLAILVFGVGLFNERRRWPGVFAIGIVLLFVPALISAAALPEMVRYSRVVQTIGNPALYAGPVGWLSGCAPGGGGAPGLPGLPFGGAALRLAAPAAIVQEKEVTKIVTQQQSAQAPRVRQFFPETLLWVPELKTDTSGFAALDVPLADSITTWRVTALASTQDGQLGFSNAALRVFQDFFADIDLPVALTQNDEVSIPIAVYNYLKTAQNVRLQVKQEAWFELQDEPEKAIQIAANDIEVVYFRIRVKQFGEQAFQVTALGDKMSDAIKRGVTVVPDGQLFRKSTSDWLRQGTSVTATIPIESIAGTARIEVKIYPGVVSQVVEGLEKILRLPYG